MSLVLALASLLSTPSYAWDSSFNDAISRVESMVWDSQINAMVQRQGLRALNVTWEDTGRYKGSSVGPNISDMTIGVRDAQGALHPMPVIRFDNFRDVTADIDPDVFQVLVGNEKGQGLEPVNMATLLQNPRNFLHSSWSWSGSRRSLWAGSRDAHLLVSAQACFLPVSRYGEATFTPVLYNYQSYPGNPAVLAIVATREGTSMQVVENDGGYMSEVLYFNQDGQRAPFTATRASEYRRWSYEDGDNRVSDAEAEEEGLNVVLLIQVPLRQVAPPPPVFYGGMGFDESAPTAGVAKSAPMQERSDVENAIIGHGDIEGPYKEFNGLSIERDTRFPVRVTVQFYKATSNGVASEADIRAIRRSIDRVYHEADYVGSLVTSGYTGRSTEWVAPPQYPPYGPYPYPYPTNTIPEVQDSPWAAPTWSWMKSQ